MAYRRPLTTRQMLLFALLWLSLVGYTLWVRGGRLDGPTLLTLLLSAVFVFYPIIKSWRQRHPRR